MSVVIFSHGHFVAKILKICVYNLSMLDTNIARKINLPSYVDAVEKWKQDREFVKNYKQGDIPEVRIDEIIVGKRK